MHLQEFAENSTDFQHFDVLHGRMTLPFTAIPVPGVTINHDPGACAVCVPVPPPLSLTHTHTYADWKCGTEAEGKHLAWFFDNADLNVAGIRVPRSDASAVITFIGPGSIVHFRFHTDIGE